MNAVLEAITAAGRVYDRHDFADPHLDGPTALTVTADGRVFGHLAAWGTCHIGYGGHCVQPPSSSAAYKYFHSGTVETGDGRLPVGVITLGTGHADLGQDAQTAAAHYDNTGTAVATVRAGEDAHGIWLSGRLVPGTSPERIAELQRSGVSGDWRGINGSMELVAALAVNVPGFPVPRTEQLVAAGGQAALVAAGVVAPPDPTLMPQTPAELSAFVAAAADRRERAGQAWARLAEVAAGVAADRRARAQARMGAVVASAAVDRRTRAADRIDAVLAASAATALQDATGTIPPQLKRYWTRGAGLARWAPTPHPYTALVDALRKEVPGKADGFYKGLAANLYHAALGRWPGNRDGGKGKALRAAGDRRVKTQAGAKRYGVSVGDLITADMEKAKARIAQAGKDTGKAADDVGKRAGQYAEAAGRDVAHAVGADRRPAPTPKGESEEAPAKSSGSAPESTPADTADKPKPMKTDAPVRDGGKPGERMEEDQTPPKGADGGKILDYADGKALYDDGTMTDGKQWYRVSEEQLAKAKAERAARTAKAKAAQARTASAVAAIMAAGAVRPKA